MPETLQYKIDMDFRSQWKIVSTHSAVKSNFIYVQEIGEFRSGPNYFTKREGLDSFLLKLTLRGGGILEYDGETSAQYEALVKSEHKRNAGKLWLNSDKELIHLSTVS